MTFRALNGHLTPGGVVKSNVMTQHAAAMGLLHFRNDPHSVLGYYCHGQQYFPFDVLNSVDLLSSSRAAFLEILLCIKSLTARLFNPNFHPLEVASR